MEREGAKPLEGRVARLILLVVVSVCVVLCVLCSNRQPDDCTFFFQVVIFSSFVIIGVRILTRQTHDGYLRFTWRNRLGYPVHTGLISLSVRLFVCLSVCLLSMKTR